MLEFSPFKKKLICTVIVIEKGLELFILFLANLAMVMAGEF